jgi:hypothetical protein
MIEGYNCPLCSRGEPCPTSEALRRRPHAVEADAPQSTHWEACWRDGGPKHYACAREHAIRLTEMLERERETQRRLVAALSEIRLLTDLTHVINGGKS